MTPRKKPAPKKPKLAAVPLIEHLCPMCSGAGSITAAPEPSRPLGEHGRKLWNDVHALGQVRGNIEPLLMLCERFDERTAIQVPGSAEDRAGLRALDAMIADDFERLGLRTILPNVAVEVADDWTVKLAAERS